MKIAIFLPFFSPEHNGVRNYVTELYSHLKKQKPDLKLFIITFDIQQINSFKSEDNVFVIYRIPCHVLVGRTYVIPSLKGVKLFWKIVNTEHFNFVNTHTRFFISSLLGLILAKRQKIPLWHTEHGSSFVKDGSLFTRFVARVYDEIFGRLVISSATKLFSVSKACLEFTKKLGGKRGDVIYNGINTDFWNTPERLANNITTITFCGRMVKAKGVQNLLQALALLKHLDWKLHLIGDGNYINDLKKLATDLRLADRVIWHGSKNSTFLKSILETTDIFVNPSYTEGLPTSVLEAGTMRCAVIATDVGGTSEIITNGVNGILVPAPKNEQAISHLKSSLQKLIVDKNIQRNYGNNLAKLVEEKFNWNRLSVSFLKMISL